MAMSPRLLRPRATLHPDAASWASRVASNSGSVGATSLKAVNDFCRAVDAAGLRSRFYRLNLFCGSGGLDSALVPLYRGPSLSGTQYGDATDTNKGPFVSEDYAETGATGGLTGNGSSKYLDTGFALNTLPSNLSGHISVYNNNRSANNIYRGMAGNAALQFGLAADNGTYSLWGNSIRIINTGNGWWVASRISDVSNVLYLNGTQIGENTALASPTLPTFQASIFCDRNTASTTRFFDSGRYQAYSIGTGLSASDVSAMNTIMAAFQTALSRA